MEHVVIDTSIYSVDPKRSKPGFRALTRLARANMVQVHLPHYVREEFLSQQRHAIGREVDAIQSAAKSILRRTECANVVAFVEKTLSNVETVRERVTECIAEEFQSWINECKVAEHPVGADHGKRVTDDYFSGSAPFRSPKSRIDIPDSFIWHTILDVADATGAVNVVSADGVLRKTAEEHSRTIPHETLDAFIQSDACQNVDIVSSLVGVTVRHPAIPDDNNEAQILMVVGAPAHTEFAFDEIEHYGDGELAIPFATRAECTLNYAISKRTTSLYPTQTTLASTTETSIISTRSRTILST